MEEIKVIEGEIFKDERGQISSLNNFRFGEVERFYFIQHPKTDVIRGWNGIGLKRNGFIVLKEPLHWCWLKSTTGKILQQI